MDTLIVILAGIIMCLGIAGSFLPVLPGPLTSWIGFIVLNTSDAFSLSSTFIIVTGIIAVVIFYFRLHHSSYWYKKNWRKSLRGYRYYFRFNYRSFFSYTRWRGHWALFRGTYW